MHKRGLAQRAVQPRIRQILSVFSTPKTPRQAERELGIKKLKLKILLENHLLECLNPEARKCRLYLITGKTKKMLRLSEKAKKSDKDWELLGWARASPRQRTVILKALDSIKRTSEEIRERASQSNQHLTRISTKSILKELVEKGLASTEICEGKRYYWISDEGLLLKSQLEA